MLALQNQAAQFLNLNLRPEKHGDENVPGADLKLSIVTGGKSDIKLEDVTVDGFSIEPMDGGSVVLTFRVKCNPDEKAVGKLSTLMGGEIEFSLMPPEDVGTLREAA